MKVKTSNLNRETYLQEATKTLRKSLFSPKGYKVPTVKLSISWASRGNKSSKTKSGVSVLGQCYPTQLSDDGINHVIITPALNGSTLEGSLRILGVLVHELVHAVDNCESGHGQAFKQCATAVGLTGQMRSTGESEWLQQLLTDKVIKKLGLFPHETLRTGGRTQTTRNIKVSCSCCDFSFRTSNKNLNMIHDYSCPTACGGTLSW